MYPFGLVVQCDTCCALYATVVGVVADACRKATASALALLPNIMALIVLMDFFLAEDYTIGRLHVVISFLKGCQQSVSFRYDDGS